MSILVQNKKHVLVGRVLWFGEEGRIAASSRGLLIYAKLVEGFF